MMRLGLSSAAAPSATLEQLLDSCARRGLSALELREEDEHGVHATLEPLAAARVAARAWEAGVTIAGYVTTSPGLDLALVRVAAAMDTPLLVAGPGGVEQRLDRAVGLAAVGGDPVIVVGGEAVMIEAEQVAARGLDLAWEADPGREPLGVMGSALLDRFGDRLRTVRIRGGGPEAAMQEGRGVGELMGRLALAGYAGAVVLSPSSNHYRLAWEAWLGRRGGWGCGSKSADPSLVGLAGAVGGGA